MTRAATLRLSLLVSLGIVPAACGGTTAHHPDGGAGDTGGGGATNQAGTRAHGGSMLQGGTTAEGGTVATGGTGVVIGGTVGTGGTGQVLYPICSTPKTDPVTGLVSCDEGYTHRPQAKACGVVLDAAAGAGGEGPVPQDPIAKPRADGSVACDQDPGVCHQFEYGFCSKDAEGGGLVQPTCVSGCLNDSDCGAGSICVCDTAASPTGGACRAASCGKDADCPSERCASYQTLCGRGGFACLSNLDECITNEDCNGVGSCSISPFDSATPHRACILAACGRPFLVRDQPRLAPLAARGEWHCEERALPRTEHLTREERATLAAHWSYMGQMEHASIAAFARFQLQLLALGAPPALVEACTAALADETAHTKLCFGIASAYAGRAVGPGPLDINGSLSPTSLADVVELVIAEGCFGETSAALEALESADNASDPVIVGAYDRIAEDEQRHAELAFRFVRWAAEQDGRVVSQVRAAMQIERGVSSTVKDIVEACFDGMLGSRAAA